MKPISFIHSIINPFKRRKPSMKVSLFFTLLFPLCLHGQEKVFKLLNYGTFEDSAKYLVKGQNADLTYTIGKQAKDGLKDTIQLFEGIQFGIEFQISSMDSSTTHFQVKIEVPGQLEVRGSQLPTNSIEYEFAGYNNKTQRVSLRLGDKEDLLPGEWKFRIEYDRNSMFTKSFFLYE